MYRIIYYDIESRTLVVKEYPEDQKDRFDFEARRWAVEYRTKDTVFIPIPITQKEFEDNILDVGEE